MGLTFKLQGIQLRNRCHQEKINQAFKEITKRLTSDSFSNYLVINCRVPSKNERLTRNLMFLIRNNSSSFNLVNNHSFIRLKLKERLIARSRPGISDKERGTNYD